MLSAFEIKAKRVLIDDKPIQLPLDIDTNQFAIIRPLDPIRSKQNSYLDNFMIAIMKEIHIKNEKGDLLSSESQQKSDLKRKSTRREKMAHLEPTYLETHVEIYQVHNQQPTLGAIVKTHEVKPEFDPKNISTFHKEEDWEEEDKKPVNRDFNFCCWYLIDNVNHNINFTLLLDRF